VPSAIMFASFRAGDHQRRAILTTSARVTCPGRSSFTTSRLIRVVAGLTVFLVGQLAEIVSQLAMVRFASPHVGAAGDHRAGHASKPVMIGVRDAKSSEIHQRWHGNANVLHQSAGGGCEHIVDQVVHNGLNGAVATSRFLR